MKLGYSTNAFVRFSLFDAVRKIAGLGFGGVEIMADRPHLYPQDWGHDSRRSLKDLIRNLNLRVTNLNSFTLFAVGDTYLPSWIEPAMERREIRIRHTLECLKLASYLGCPNISVPPGGPLHGMTRQEAFSLFYKGLQRVAPLAEELQVKVLVEPEPDLFLENSTQFKEFIREIRSPCIGLNFDIGHFFCAGEDPAEAFQELLPWIGHVHIEDIAASRRHYHLIPGLGAIDYGNTLATILRTGYDGDISLELYTYADRPVEAGRESLDFLLPFMRGAGFEVDNMLGKPQDDFSDPSLRSG
ncbi:MAG TPA: sugar phosphate isomerase/epimerase [Desulfomonilia bacterium]|nr:sugar phosphate isomerase/epimerase [Desulfomonilia bacterium]